MFIEKPKVFETYYFEKNSEHNSGFFQLTEDIEVCDGVLTKGTIVNITDIGTSNDNEVKIGFGVGDMKYGKERYISLGDAETKLLKTEELANADEILKKNKDEIIALVDKHSFRSKREELALTNIEKRNPNKKKYNKLVRKFINSTWLFGVEIITFIISFVVSLASLCTLCVSQSSTSKTVGTIFTVLLAFSAMYFVKSFHFDNFCEKIVREKVEEIKAENSKIKKYYLNKDYIEQQKLLAEQEQREMHKQMLKQSLTGNAPILYNNGKSIPTNNGIWEQYGDLQLLRSVDEDKQVL